MSFWSLVRGLFISTKLFLLKLFALLSNFHCSSLKHSWYTFVLNAVNLQIIKILWFKTRAKLRFLSKVRVETNTELKDIENEWHRWAWQLARFYAPFLQRYFELATPHLGSFWICMPPIEKEVSRWVSLVLTWINDCPERLIENRTWLGNIAFESRVNCTDSVFKCQLPWRFIKDLIF